ncbi:vanadium-dependent haloperoxidase [Jiulongibacter sediminis]|uniref:Phosphatidic acid phosphatase n=1 Tax=Jiulongibacter sediminis TaxID=1605367 RepID=A0A0P7C2X8_9BACT|nr:vanadium-dependent haloperoxidase [Jiulongibacter sediminis]KPM48514.1 phosphatidic acid phosphatase [Jiulongibacter sediminis]TBX25052.1 phosphatidic acid phosphatase [Jiulongibacter sediminis]
MKKIIGMLGLLAVLVACNRKTPEEYGKITNNPMYYHDAVDKITEVIIHDIFSPPVASRIYNYSTLAGYEAMVHSDERFQSLDGQFKDFNNVPQPEDGKEYCYPLAGIKALLTVARSQTFTVDKYDDFENGVYADFKEAGVPSDVFERSMEYGEAVANHVMEFAKGDNYAQTRGLRYTVKSEPGYWVPTPPQYGDAMEPYWMTIRPMLLDSANQFPPPPPPAYSLDKSSPFWTELMEVYNISKTRSDEQESMAWFWDDNAFVMNVQGHVMFANKKMTPGGHWLAIAKTVLKDQEKDLMESAEAYLMVSTALHEAFICSWHEKYRTEKIRPETVINATFDPDWVPFLQTPPFPEYTSGHSTISAASAEALTGLLGDNISFIDSTEYEYGHGVKEFPSFREAATACSYSRMYGGIHYRSGCEQGQAAGIKIGQFVLANTKTRK